jgi:hypothetical protein
MKSKPWTVHGKKMMKTMSIPDEQIQRVMQLLTHWNPLGDSASEIPDLDNYETEAADILSHIYISGPGTNPARIVRDVLNQAFGLSLSSDDCADIGKEIDKIIK